MIIVKIGDNMKHPYQCTLFDIVFADKKVFHDQQGVVWNWLQKANVRGWIVHWMCISSRRKGFRNI